VLLVFCKRLPLCRRRERQSQGKATCRATCGATARQWWWHRSRQCSHCHWEEKVKVMAELSREEEQQMVDGLKNTYRLQ